MILMKRITRKDLIGARQIVEAIMRQRKIEPAYGARELRMFTAPKYVAAEIDAIMAATANDAARRKAAIMDKLVRGCCAHLDPGDVRDLDEWGKM